MKRAELPTESTVARTPHAGGTRPRPALWRAAALIAALVSCAQSTPPQGTVSQGGASDVQVVGSVYDGTDRSWIAGPSELVPVLPQSIDPGDNTLSYEPLVAATNAWGPVERNTSNGEYRGGDGRPMSLNGKTYLTGFGVHAASSLRFALNGKCSGLTADVGIDDEVGDRGSAVFQVYADGAKLFDSGLMTGASPTQSVKVDLTGRSEVQLVVTNGDDTINYDHADWADARLLGCTKLAPPVGPVALPAGQALRINAGGPAQSVDGVKWIGCEAEDRCLGYVRGGFAYTPAAPPAIADVQSPANPVIYQSEWTGGESRGVPAGGTAFAFAVPVANGSYLLRLHFAELNKEIQGARLFDVTVEGAPALTGLDLYQVAGRGRAVVREVPVTVSDGQLNVAFIRRVENAKLSGLEILPAVARSQSADLLVQPAALVLSSPQNEASPAQTVTLTNTGGAAVQLDRLGFSPERSGFELVNPPTLPLALGAGQRLTLAVRMAASGPLGVSRAILSAEGGGLRQEVALSGLRATGEQGDLEPPLAQIVDALGYSMNVGGTGLLLGTGVGLIGDEVAAPLFQRVGAGPVVLRPVARYSPDGPVPYGTFTLVPGTAQIQNAQVRATIAAGQEQTLNPALQPGGSTSFDPGADVFGVYLAANSYAAQTTSTLDSLNTGRTRHAVRVYPLRNRAGELLAGSYLLAVEPSANGDYQDAVFVIENVRPVAAPAAAPPAVAAPLTWSARAAAPSPLYEAQGAVIGGQLYVLGGFNRNDLTQNGKPIATAAVQVYTSATNSWRTLRDLPEAVTHAGAAVDGQTIYLAGGFLGNHPGPQTNHVWKYDVPTDRWSAMPALPAARGAGALVRLGRDLHFFGGTERNGLTYLRDSGDHWVLSLDNPVSWRPAAPLPNPRNHLSATVVGDLIYALGGQHLGDESGANQSDLQVYDARTDRWRTLRSLPLPLSHTAASTIVWNGRIVVVGGVTQGAAESARVTEYDPATDTWSELAALPGVRQSPVAGVVANQLIVTTGSVTEGPTNTTWVGTR